MNVEAGVVMPDPLSLIRCVCLFLRLFMCCFPSVCVNGVMKAGGLWQVENGPGLFI